MSSVFGPSIAAATLVRVACPHCKEVQARVRKMPHERYRCRRCHKTFTRQEGEQEAARGGGSR